MSFESKFPNLYKGPYDEEKVCSWPDIKISGKVTPNTLVVYYPNPDEHTIFSPFRPGEIVLYLGEIVHMKSHGVFVDRNGKVQYGYHTWSFRVIPGEEV